MQGEEWYANKESLGTHKDVDREGIQSFGNLERNVALCSSMPVSFGIIHKGQQAAERPSGFSS